MAADTNTSGGSGGSGGGSGGSGGPVLAIALGAVVIVVAVVLVMSINSAPVDTVKGGDKPTDVAADKPADKPAEPTDKPAAKGDYPPGTVVIGADSGEELVDVAVELPNPVFAGTPKVIPDNVNVDRKRLGNSRGGIVGPKGLTNVAVDKKVTSSDKFPIIGDLDQVTDGDKEALDGRMVELAPGKQWVQIDLGKEQEIWVVMVWHNHLDPRVYRDVIVQVSNDTDFKEGVTTVFNNDNDNSSEMGVGKDFEYFESFEGELVNAGGAKGRYVRCWTKGSTADDANHYSEVEVWGRDPK